MQRGVHGQLRGFRSLNGLCGTCQPDDAAVVLGRRPRAATASSWNFGSRGTVPQLESQIHPSSIHPRSIHGVEPHGVWRFRRRAFGTEIVHRRVVVTVRGRLARLLGDMAIFYFPFYFPFLFCAIWVLHIYILLPYMYIHRYTQAVQVHN